MLDNYLSVRQAIESLALTTWGVPRVRTDRPALTDSGDRAFVVRLEIARPFTGSRNVCETYSFLLGVRKDRPQSADLDALRITASKLMGEALLAYDWSLVGAYRPRVDSIPQPDYEEIEDAYYDSLLSFSVDTDVFQ